MDTIQSFEKEYIMNKKLYSTTAAAKLLDVHPNTIRNMVKDGRLSSIKTRGKTGDYRFRQADIDAYLSNLGNPNITVAASESTAPLLENKITAENELSFLISCANPLHIFGSYLETLKPNEYSHALRGKSVIWVKETFRQIRLQFPHSSLSTHMQLEDFLEHIQVGISGMRRSDGKNDITSFLLFTDEDGTLVLDGTLQQFYPTFEPGIVTLKYGISNRYYWGLERMNESAFNSAANDPKQAYFKQYLLKLLRESR